MRAIALLLVLILAAMPVSGQTATDPDIIEIRLKVGADASSAVATTAADIEANQHQFIFFEVDAKDSDFGGEILTMELTVFTPGGQLVVRPTLVAKDPSMCSSACKETWRGSLAVDDSRLTVGQHPIELHVYDRNGGHTSCRSDVAAGACAKTGTLAPLEIRWANAGQTSLSLIFRSIEKVNNAYPAQNMGAGAKLSAQVFLGESNKAGDQLPWALRNVQYQSTTAKGTTPLVNLAPPYTLGGNQLVQGDQDIKVIATDRSGRTATIDIHAFVDTMPPVVTPTIPKVTYQNVTFPIGLDIQDARPYTAIVTVESSSQEKSGSTASPVTKFEFKRLELGLNNIVIRVQDDLGNQFLQQYNVTTVEATTDSAISVQVTPAFPLPEEEVTVAFTAKQQSGVTDLMFDIGLDVSRLGSVFSDTVLVPLNGDYKFTFGRTYLPGQYDFNATIYPVEGINETDMSDQVDVGSFEVFLGKVVKDDKSWYIRAGPSGEAVEAVTAGGKVFKLTAAERGNLTLYEFKDGDQNLYWNPFQRITDLDDESASDPDEDAPGLAPILAALALLGAAMFARRRM